MQICCYKPSSLLCKLLQGCSYFRSVAIPIYFCIFECFYAQIRRPFITRCFLPSHELANQGGLICLWRYRRSRDDGLFRDSRSWKNANAGDASAPHLSLVFFFWSRAVSVYVIRCRPKARGKPTTEPNSLRQPKRRGIRRSSSQFNVTIGRNTLSQ